MRDAIICGTPNFGPWADSTACVIEPSKVPTVNATAACQNDRPKAATPSTPTKIVANSRLGDVQVQSICRADAVPLGQRDELGAAWFDGREALAVLAFPDLGDDLDVIGGSTQSRHGRPFLRLVRRRVAPARYHG